MKYEKKETYTETRYILYRWYLEILKETLVKIQTVNFFTVQIQNQI